MSWRNIERYVRSMSDRADRLSTPEAVEDRFGRYRDEPVSFCREVLGFVGATLRSSGAPYQATVMQDVAEHPRVSVRSGHGVGKSTVAALLTIWWLLTRPMGRVLIVAPEFSRQVKAVLFGEIRKWVRRAKEPLPIQVLSSRVLVEGFGEEWAAIGLPATEPHRIEGFHADGGLLLIVDETKGVPNDAYDALMGALTGEGGNRLLVTSTPGPPAGRFFEIHTRRMADWRLHHIPSPDSSMVSEAWVEQRREEWGEGSPLYQARVLGVFPEEAEGTLLRLSDLEAAVGRTVDQSHPAPVSLGVDVARFGDDRTVVATWRGGVLSALDTRGGLDTMEVASWVSSLINQTTPQRVAVDEIGIGAGVVDRLLQLGHHQVEGVAVSRSAQDPALHANLRSELAWQFRTALERGELSLPDDDALLAELSAIRYGYTPSGQIILEPKKETKKRVGRSPDLADAAILGFGIVQGYQRVAPLEPFVSTSYFSPGHGSAVPVDVAHLSNPYLPWGPR